MINYNTSTVNTPASVFTNLIWENGLFSPSQLFFFVKSSCELLLWKANTFLIHHICLILVVWVSSKITIPADGSYFSYQEFSYFWDCSRFSNHQDMMWAKGEQGGEGKNRRCSSYSSFSQNLSQTVAFGNWYENMFILEQSDAQQVMPTDIEEHCGRLFSDAECRQ